MRTRTTTREVLDTNFPEFIHLKKEPAVLPAEYPATSNQNGYRHREEKNNGIIWPNIRPLLIRPDTGTGKKKITELYGRISGASHQQKTDLQKTAYSNTQLCRDKTSKSKEILFLNLARLTGPMDYC